jgi:hypothetical protein
MGVSRGAVVLCMGGVLAFAGTAIAAGAGVAPSRDVLGLSLGAEWLIEECPTRKLMSDLTTYQSDYEIKVKPCFKSRRQLGLGRAALLNEGEMVYLMLGDTPAGIKGDFALAWHVEGKLESITLYTYGRDVQENVFSQLTDKFGQPAALETEELQNSYGAKFSSIKAEWKFSDLDVSFTGIGGKVDSGYVTIETPTGKRVALQDVAKRRASQPKL